MRIRHSRKDDLGEIMALYASARKFMQSNGNPTQWINGYPQRELIAREIYEGKSFVCMDGDVIAAVFSLICGEEPTYQEIYEGQWMNERPYGTIHRICVGERRKGVAEFCLRWCLEQCGNIRIDTHQDNLPMQNLLKKCGYTYCGWIKIEDGSKRVAFQKVKE